MVLPLTFKNSDKHEYMFVFIRLCTVHLCLQGIVVCVYVKGKATDIAIQAEEIIRSKTVMNELFSKHTRQPISVVGKLVMVIPMFLLMWTTFSHPGVLTVGYM